MRFWLIAVAAAVTGLSGCAQGPATGVEGFSARGPTCISTFRELDQRQWWTGSVLSDEDRTIPLAIQPLVVWLRSNGCITYSRDLVGMETAPHEVAAAPADTGRYTPGLLVHAGVVTSMADDARARGYFSSLGYDSYSLGTAGLGRRIYVGPLATEAQAQNVLTAARRAGFDYPYVRQGLSGSFFGGFVQSRGGTP
jgi:hypothetical protein